MRIPSILKDLLPSDSVKQLMELIHQPNLVSGLKDAAQQLGWKEAWGTTQLQHAMLQTKKWMETFSARWTSQEHDTLRLGVNATGLLLSSRWSSPPMSSPVISTLAVVASSYSERSAIAQDIYRLLATMTGAPTALVTHSLEQAIFLLRYGLPEPKRWAIPRADCIRLSSNCDLAYLLAPEKSNVLEIGASNSCSRDDFARAVESGAGGFIRLEPYRVTTSYDAEDSEVDSGIRIVKDFRLPVVELLLNGSLIELESIGIAAPTPSNRISKGAAAVILSGDGWIGGPPCGIILGNENFMKPLIEKSHRLGMTAHPLMMAALHAAMVAGKDVEAWKQTPLGQMVSNSVENLNQRAKRLAIQIEGTPQVENAVAAVERFPIASDPIDSIQLESGVVRIEPRGISAKEMKNKLAMGESPLWCLADDRFLTLVLRSVDPADDREIVAAFDPTIRSTIM